MASELRAIDLTVSVLKRWWAKTDRKPSGCLNWTGSRRWLSSNRDYPTFSIAGRQRGAQQVAWRLANPTGPLPARITQHCGNDLCVEPSHQRAAETNLKQHNLNKARA
jgi:hypothetical protein